MWGGNAFFAAGAALAVGLLARSYGWESAFCCAAGLFFLGFLASLRLPSDKRSTARAS